jgi:transposase
MKDCVINDCAAFIGIDWAHTKHDICLQAAGSERIEHYVLSHSPERIEAWARELEQRFSGDPIAVCLELSKGPIVSALQKYAFLILCPVNPATLNKYRQAFAPSGAKDDPTDAALQLELLQRHPDKLKPLHPERPQVRALQQLVESRRRLAQDKTRIVNRLTQTLKNYYPQPLEWFAKKDTKVFCDFIDTWPNLTKAKNARVRTITKFFNAHNVRRTDRIEQRIDAIKSAMPLTIAPGVVLPNQLLAKSLIALLRTTIACIATFDDEIARLTAQLPDAPLFSSLPGAGPVLAPRLLAAFGEQRDRFESAAELQKLSGVAPVTERSGQKTWVHWRWACTTNIRQSFVEWAGETIPRSVWAKAFYQQQMNKGVTHHAALRALAFKWIRILYRCWKTHTPYDETTYLKALQKRGSPLLERIAHP